MSDRTKKLTLDLSPKAKINLVGLAIERGLTPGQLVEKWVEARMTLSDKLKGEVSGIDATGGNS